MEDRALFILHNLLNTMAADDLVMQGAMASAAKVLNQFNTPHLHLKLVTCNLKLSLGHIINNSIRQASDTILIKSHA